MLCEICRFALWYKNKGPYCSFPSVIWPKVSEAEETPTVADTFYEGCFGNCFQRAPWKREYGIVEWGEELPNEGKYDNL